MTEDTCISCGGYVPEGRMVCLQCYPTRSEDVDMAIILNNTQHRQLKADLAELAAYRATGFTPEAINQLIFPEPAPLPLDLHGDEDYSAAAGILVNDGHDPAAEAAGRRETDQWDK